MAIWTPDEGASPRFGISGGDLWAAGQGSNVLSNLPRNANRLARRQYRQWTRQAPWLPRWAGLTLNEKEEWEWFAAENYFHALTGQPARVGGQEYFLRYWAQATLFNGADIAGPWTPPDAPDWPGSTKPFSPTLATDEGMAVLVQETTEEDRDYFFVGQPPTQGRARLTRAECVPIGRWTLPPSLAGAFWHEPADAALALFGERFTDPSWQQWLLAWQLSGWSPRPVLDPCWTPPPPDCPALMTAFMTFPSFVPYSVGMPMTLPCQEWEGYAGGGGGRVIKRVDEFGVIDWQFDGLIPVGLNVSGWRRNTPIGTGSYAETIPAGAAITVT